jgi:hypothetical protein
LGIARNTVRAALASGQPPRYERSSRGSLVDAAGTDVRKLLAGFPRMPATVNAERIGWEYSITALKDRIRQFQPEYAGVDPADRIIYRPGEIVQCGSSFPEPHIPVGHGQNLMLAVLAMTLGFSRLLTATMLPSRQAGDLLAGMWDLINALGKVPKTLIWDGIGHRRQGGGDCSGAVVRRHAGDPIQLARRGTRSSSAWWSATTGTSGPRSCRDGLSRRRHSSTRSLPAGFRRPTGAWCVPPDAGPTSPWTLI